MTSVKKSTVLVSILTIVALVCLWTSDSGSISTTKKQLDLKSGPSVYSDSLNFTKVTPVNGFSGTNGTPYWQPAARKVGVTIKATVYGHGYAKATMTSASIGSWSLSGSEYSTADAGSAPVIFGVTVQRMGEATVSHTTTSELIHKAKGNYNWSGSGNVERFAGEWREGSTSGILTGGTTGKWHFVGVGSDNGSGNGSWEVIHNYECNTCKTRSDDPLTAPHKLKTWKCGHTTMGCLPGSHGDTTVTCPLGPNNQTCSYGSYYPCSPHTCSYPSGSGSGCANAPGRSVCNDEGTCATRTGSGVPGECGHEWCCCTPGAPISGGSTPPSGGSTPPTLVACAGASETGCPGATSRWAHRVLSCSNCNRPYYTCDPNAYRNHEEPLTCRRSGCGQTFTRCSNTPTSCQGSYYHWAQ